MEAQRRTPTRYNFLRRLRVRRAALLQSVRPERLVERPVADPQVQAAALLAAAQLEQTLAQTVYYLKRW